MFGSSSPEKILKEVEIYLSDINVPNYTVIQTLKRGIKAFPESIELKAKLKEVESNTDLTVSKSSPKTLYGILFVAISFMGIGQLFLYFTSSSNSFSLILGVSFLLIAFIIFRQYRKET